MQEEWTQNRTDVGLAILGLTWASVFGSAAAVADGEGPWPALSGFAGLVAAIALTRLGLRLAFGREANVVAAAVLLTLLLIVLVGGALTLFA